MVAIVLAGKHPQRVRSVAINCAAAKLGKTGQLLFKNWIDVVRVDPAPPGPSVAPGLAPGGQLIEVTAHWALAGTEVTALYEITPVGSDETRLPALRYGSDRPAATGNGEIAHLRLRYKQPGSDQSRLIETPIRRTSLRPTASDSLMFTAAVAGFADTLRGGTHIDGWGWDGILAAARSSGRDRSDSRNAGFIDLVEQARLLVEHGDNRSAGAAAVSD